MENVKKPLICLLAAPEASPAVLYGLFDVLSSVGAVYSDMTTGVSGEELLEVKIVAESKKPFRCFGNVLIEPHASIEDINEADAVIVCDLYTPIDTSPRGNYPREIEWLKKMYSNKAILTSVCAGSLVLAETGLMDGLEIACHWAYRHMIREYYPKIKLREASALNLSASNKRLITAGGASSWQDLAMYLITHFCGEKHAIYTANIFLLSNHIDGQLPYAGMTKCIKNNDPLIGECLSWISENYACTNPVARMTHRAGLQPRTFARRFYVATGYHPLDYVQELRIEIAKNLLVTEATNVEEISVAVGYEDPTSFRRLFKRKAGISPAVYRKKFASIIAQRDSHSGLGLGYR